MASRRGAIESAFQKAMAPRPAPRVKPGSSLLQIAAQVVRAEREPGVGGMTRVLYALPPEERAAVQQAANWYAHERDLGRHGDVSKVTKHFDVSDDVARKVVDGLEVDYVANELQKRRPGDGAQPLPELTRRDYIEAAVHAHTATPSDAE